MIRRMHYQLSTRQVRIVGRAMDDLDAVESHRHRARRVGACRNTSPPRDRKSTGRRPGSGRPAPRSPADPSRTPGCRQKRALCSVFRQPKRAGERRKHFSAKTLLLKDDRHGKSSMVALNPCVRAYPPPSVAESEATVPSSQVTPLSSLRQMATFCCQGSVS